MLSNALSAHQVQPRFDPDSVTRRSGHRKYFNSEERFTIESLDMSKLKCFRDFDHQANKENHEIVKSERLLVLFDFFFNHSTSQRHQKCSKV